MKLSHTLYSTTALGLLLGLSMPGDAFAHGSAAPLVAESEAAKAEPKNSSAAEWLFNSFVKEANAASSVAISIKGAYRYIRSNGLPNHGTGRFPNRGNPNAIRAQSYRFKMPARPKLSGRITRLGRQPFGVAINGVVFDPGTAEYWRNDPRSGWRYEALGGAVRLGLDRNNAHVQPNGAYHYHAAPKGLMSRSNYRAKPMLIGWAADGFPIYTPFGFRDPKSSKSGMKQLRSGYRIKRGVRPSGLQRNTSRVSSLVRRSERSGACSHAQKYTDSARFLTLSFLFSSSILFWRSKKLSIFVKPLTVVVDGRFAV